MESSPAAAEPNGLAWEDLGSTDWDQVSSEGAAEPPSQHEGDDDGLLLALNSQEPRASKAAPRRQAITKADREFAALVHHSSVLCLCARTRLLDLAADEPELQARVVSQLDPLQVSRLLAPQPSTQRATSCLLPVLQLFRGVWGLLPPGAMGQRGGSKGAAGGGPGSGPLDDPLGEAWGSLLHQALTACSEQAGSEEVLVTLFVALVRSYGQLARVVRLLDAAPLHPWRRKAPVLRTHSNAPGASQTPPARKTAASRAPDPTRGASTSLPALPASPAAAAAAATAAAAAAAAKGKAGRGRGSSGDGGGVSGGPCPSLPPADPQAGPGLEPSPPAPADQAGQSGRPTRSSNRTAAAGVQEEGRSPVAGVGVQRRGRSKVPAPRASHGSDSGGRGVGESGKGQGREQGQGAEEGPIGGAKGGRVGKGSAAAKARLTKAMKSELLTRQAAAVQAGGGSRVGGRAGRGAAAPQAESGASAGAGGQAGPKGEEGPKPAPSRNKGDEELEAALHMAMLATEAEQTARQAASTAAAAAQLLKTSTAPPPSALPPPAPSLTAKQRLELAAGLSKRGAATQPGGSQMKGAEGGRASGWHETGSGSGGKPGRGRWVSARPAVCCCWAEVWCGSAEYGRWVHVDVAGQQVDRAAGVSAAASAAGGYAAVAAYVVASEHGQLRDVTARYLTNSLALTKVRDVGWWAEAWPQLQAIPPTSGTGHGVGVGAGTGPGASGAASMCDKALNLGSRLGSSRVGEGQQQGQQGQQGHQQQQQQQPSRQRMQQQALEGGGQGTAGCEGPGPAAPLGSPPPAAALAAPLPSLKPDVPQPHGAQAGGRSAAAAAVAGAPPTAAAAAPAAAAAARMRAAREDAELAHAHKAGLLGLPTSLEGFKAHPTFVLRRHITKYQALRPGTVPLGLHKGEAYYARAALSELHTPERWLREGWRVLEEELARPAKVVKKRAVPPLQQHRQAGGGRGSGGKGRWAFAGGRGSMLRFNSQQGATLGLGAGAEGRGEAGGAAGAGRGAGATPPSVPTHVTAAAAAAATALAAVVGAGGQHPGGLSGGPGPGPEGSSAGLEQRGGEWGKDFGRLRREATAALALNAALGGQHGGSSSRFTAAAAAAAAPPPPPPPPPPPMQAPLQEQATTAGAAGGRPLTQPSAMGVAEQELAGEGGMEVGHAAAAAAAAAAASQSQTQPLPCLPDAAMHLGSSHQGAGDREGGRQKAVTGQQQEEAEERGEGGRHQQEEFAEAEEEEEVEEEWEHDEGVGSPAETMAAAPSGVGQVPAGGAGPGAEVVHLYGQWQCAPHVARALNGQVPVNARGNVEVPPLAQAMPLGCVHLQYPGLGPVCRALGISWAPALVGFELSAGRSVPKIDGVVVCEEYERAVVASYLERETARQEAAAARQRREARAAWLQLLYAVRKRLQLADAYQTTNVGAQPTPDVLAAGPSGSNGKSQTKRKRSKAVELEGTQNADDAVASAVAEAARRRIRKRLDKEDEPRLDAHDTCNRAAAADQEEF